MAPASHPDGERRRHERRAVEQPVVLEIDGERRPARLKDVGAGGALIDDTGAIEPGRDVTLVVPGHDLSAKAVVRRADPRGVGLEFDDDTVGLIIGGWVSSPD